MLIKLIFFNILINIKRKTSNVAAQPKKITHAAVLPLSHPNYD